MIELWSQQQINAVLTPERIAVIIAHAFGATPDVTDLTIALPDGGTATIVANEVSGAGHPRAGRVVVDCERLLRAIVDLRQNTEVFQVMPTSRTVVIREFEPVRKRAVASNIRAIKQ